jgi:hypothetical protein
MSLPAKFTDNLTAFFDRHPLAESATFTKAGGSPATIKVHFYDKFQMATPLAVAYESLSPTARCKEGDLNGIAHGDTLAVRGTTYKISGIEPGGAGTTWLILSQDADE